MSADPSHDDKGGPALPSGPDKNAPFANSSAEKNTIADQQALSSDTGRNGLLDNTFAGPISKGEGGATSGDFDGTTKPVTLQDESKLLHGGE